MARRRFFVDEVRSGRAQILGEAAHHLTRVLRVEPGQKFEISDNRAVFLAEVETARKDLVSFAVLEPLKAVEPVPRITLLASLIRFERFEWLIEKATELGVEEIIPIIADRAETGLDRAAEKRIVRWRKIAREASEQSRRARMPEIARPTVIPSMDSCDYRYVLDELDGQVSGLPHVRKPTDRVALLVGPEGGWTDRERVGAFDRGWQPLHLGNTILRTETAAIAAIAVIVASWQAELRLP